MNYFEQILARIRDIRSSEKDLWKKVLAILKTSRDFSRKDENYFFSTMQNKMHYAAHGHTAAEVILERCEAYDFQMGLMSLSGNEPTLEELHIAKNYLNERELDNLNCIVSLYLDFAELQVKNRQIMYMKDWVEKLDEFLQISGHNVLKDFGKYTRQEADEHIKTEWKKYKKILQIEMNRGKPVIKLLPFHFDDGEHLLFGIV